MAEMDFETWMTQCGVGERYWDASRSLLREPSDLVAYMDALQENVDAGRGLLILGPIGVGKSSALALIAMAAGIPTRPRVRAWYTTVTKLLEHLLRGGGMKTLYSEFGLERGNPYQVDPRTWPLLLLDEFGSAYENPYAMAAFEDYMGWRYDHKMSACVAGNVTPLALQENPHYLRMVDRWRETSTVIRIVGKSMRTRLGDQG